MALTDEEIDKALAQWGAGPAAAAPDDLDAQADAAIAAWSSREQPSAPTSTLANPFANVQSGSTVTTTLTPHEQAFAETKDRGTEGINYLLTPSEEELAKWRARLAALKQPDPRLEMSAAEEYGSAALPAAMAAVPTAGGALGAAGGAALGLATGPAAPVMSPLLAILGGLGLGAAAGKGQEAALGAAGLADDAGTLLAEEREAHPLRSAALELAPQLAVARPSAALNLAGRAAGAGIAGGVDYGMQRLEGRGGGRDLTSLVTGEEAQPLDLKRLLMQMAAGGLLDKSWGLGKAGASPTKPAGKKATAADKLRDLPAKGSVDDLAAAIAEKPPPVEAPAAEVPQGPFVPAPDVVAGDVPPAGSTFTTTRGSQTPLPERIAGHVLAKFDDTLDVQRTMVDAAKHFDDFKPERRGPVSWEQTVGEATELAARLGRDDVTPADLEALTRKVPVEELASRLTLVRELALAQGQRLDGAIAAYQSGATPATKAAVALELNKFGVLGGEAFRFGSETGRALNILKRQTGDMARSKNVKAILDKFGGEAKVDTIVQILESLPDAASRAKTTRALLGGGWKDKLYFAWINGLVSGPQTHVVNTLSNTQMQLLNAVETAGASVIGGARQFGRSAKVDRVYPREAVAVLTGPLRAASDMMVGLKEGNARMEPGRVKRAVEKVLGPWLNDPAQKTDARYVNPFKGATGAVIGAPTTALTIEDAVFKAAAYRGALESLSYREGSRAGLRGPQLEAFRKQAVSNPETVTLRSGRTLDAVARDEAHRLTYTTQSELATSLARWANAADLNGGRKHPVLGPIVNVVLPFKRTPINVLKAAVERTPLAFGLKEVRASIKKGGAERDMALSRIVLGTMMGSYAAYQASDGTITGSGPPDPRERAMLYAMGWQPQSARIGDAYYSYARFDPLSSVLGWAADLAEVAQDAPESTTNELAGRVAIAFTHNAANKTFLRGLSDLTAAIVDPKRYGESWIRGLAGSVVPAAVAQTARTLDPRLVATDGAFDAVKARIPYVRNSLPARRDVFGEVVTLDAWGPDALSPVYRSMVKNDPVARSLVGLGMMVPRIQPYIQKDGQRITLEPKAMEKLEILAGQLTHKRLFALVTTGDWNSKTEDSRRAAVSKVIAEARDEAKDQLFTGKRDIQKMTGGR